MSHLMTDGRPCGLPDEHRGRHRSPGAAERSRESSRKWSEANREHNREKCRKWRADPGNSPKIFAQKARGTLRRIEKRIAEAT